MIGKIPHAHARFRGRTWKSLISVQRIRTKGICYFYLSGSQLYSSTLYCSRESTGYHGTGVPGIILYTYIYDKKSCGLFLFRSGCRMYAYLGTSMLWYLAYSTCTSTDTSMAILGARSTRTILEYIVQLCSTTSVLYFREGIPHIKCMGVQDIVVRIVVGRGSRLLVSYR
jgi:hypothetical protein